MLEVNKEINLENKNPIFILDIGNNELKKNLMSTSDEINDECNQIDCKIEKNKNNIIKKQSRGSLLSYENLNINEIKNENKTKNTSDDNKNQARKDLIRSPKLNRESFQKISKDNKSNFEINKEDLPINKNILKKFLIIIKYLSGSLISSGSIFLLIIIIREKIIEQKLIGIIIEPLIIIISLLGMFPFKKITYKKIIIVLLIWEGTYLFPLSFYVKSSIKEDFYFLYNIILKIRTGLFLAQLLDFVMSLVFNIDI